jgi:hypothetical protein
MKLNAFVYHIVAIYWSKTSSCDVVNAYLSAVSYGKDNEKYSLLGCNTMSFGKGQTSERNMPCPLGSKNEPSKETESCGLLVSFLTVRSSDLQKGDNMKMASFWMLRHVALVRTEVSEELSTSIIRVTRNR